MEKKLGFRDKD